MRDVQLIRANMINGILRGREDNDGVWKAALLESEGFLMRVYLGAMGGWNVFE